MKLPSMVAEQPTAGGLKRDEATGAHPSRGLSFSLFLVLGWMVYATSTVADRDEEGGRGGRALFM